MYINKAFIGGNLTRDPEIKAMPNGSKVTTFSVATNRVWKDQSGAKQEATEYHNIVVFGRQAETSAQYLRKGSNCFIEGRIQTRSWEQDGQKKYRTEVVADTVQFGARAKKEETSTGYDSIEQYQSDTGIGDDTVETIEYPTDDIDPDDIPF